MAASIEPSLMHRIRYTPMRDVVRGQFTGRLDVRRRIEASGLPIAARELLSRVIGRTRLWSLEKAALVDELAAHFADGLEAGRTVDDLIKAFGDERVAARLIARAKRRNRPMIYHVLNAVLW